MVVAPIVQVKFRITKQKKEDNEAVFLETANDRSASVTTAGMTKALHFLSL